MAANKDPGPGYTKAQWDKKSSKNTVKEVKSRPLMDTLRSEHRHLGSVMVLFKEQLDAIEQGQLIDTHVIYEIMDYVVRWPNRFHHPREDLIYARVAELDASAADNASPSAGMIDGSRASAICSRICLSRVSGMTRWALPL